MSGASGESSLAVFSQEQTWMDELPHECGHLHLLSCQCSTDTEGRQIEKQKNIQLELVLWLTDTFRAKGTERVKSKGKASLHNRIHVPRWLLWVWGSHSGRSSGSFYSAREIQAPTFLVLLNCLPRLSLSPWRLKKMARSVFNWSGFPLPSIHLEKEATYENSLPSW